MIPYFFKVYRFEAIGCKIDFSKMDKNFVEKLIKELLGVSEQRAANNSVFFHKFPGNYNPWAAFIFLETSGLYVDTWPEYKIINVVFAVCKDIPDIYRVAKYIKEKFKAEKVRIYIENKVEEL